MKEVLLVDPERCRGHGICCLLAPELIDLDDWGYAQVLKSQPLSSDELKSASRAVAGCPARALSLVQEGQKDQRN